MDPLLQHTLCCKAAWGNHAATELSLHGDPFCLDARRPVGKLAVISLVLLIFLFLLNLSYLLYQFPCISTPSRSCTCFQTWAYFPTRTTSLCLSFIFQSCNSLSSHCPTFSFILFILSHFPTDYFHFRRPVFAVTLHPSASCFLLQ